jgi:hypothetical protein
VACFHGGAINEKHAAADRRHESMRRADRAPRGTVRDADSCVEKSGPVKSVRSYVRAISLSDTLALATRCLRARSVLRSPLLLL